MSADMRAMVLDTPRRPLAMRERRVPEPAAGEILLEIAACGVCRTDLHVVDGELPNPKLPIVPGPRDRRARRRTGDGRHRLGDWRAHRRALARLHLRRLSLLPQRARESPATLVTAAMPRTRSPTRVTAFRSRSARMTPRSRRSCAPA